MAEAVASFHFPDDVWARVVYDLVVAARTASDLEALVAALVPIYFGRVGSFVIENRHQTTDQAEERVERQAREFELLKPYLLERWAAVDATGLGSSGDGSNGRRRGREAEQATQTEPAAEPEPTPAEMSQ